jgi:hypothetical protein
MGIIVQMTPKFNCDTPGGDALHLQINPLIEE